MARMEEIMVPDRACGFKLRQRDVSGTMINKQESVPKRVERMRRTILRSMPPLTSMPIEMVAEWCRDAMETFRRRWARAGRR